MIVSDFIDDVQELLGYVWLYWVWSGSFDCNIGMWGLFQF